MSNWRLRGFAAALGSAALLGGALAFQHIGELPPCKLCYWQRYPHMVAIGIGVLLLLVPLPALALLGALAAATTMGIGIYHVGVEQFWWEGPNTCTSGSTVGLSPAEALNQIMAAPVVRCDDIAWSLMGISMAGWNAIASALLVLLWIGCWRRAQQG
ncbi:disulfide bond formation protein B [Oceanibium sediminis]|uniref:disulfide bond formation protein B n=1 Tax=Oceanibium sediminis TaxID=2026339 RepID=UPI000DD3DA44|nr:disulfide bond formation protein B [Oceanibium sediminis]